MNDTHTATEDHGGGDLYEIRIKGHLHERWAAWFEGLTLTSEASGDTLISGQVADQAALHGLLRKVRDLGMELLAVSRVKTVPADTPVGEPPHAT